MRAWPLPSLKIGAPPRLAAPALSADGRQLRVTVPVRPGADAGAVVREVSAALQQLARGSTACSQRQKVRAGRAVFEDSSDHRRT
jgi:hypothetical protein